MNILLRKLQKINMISYVLVEIEPVLCIVYKKICFYINFNLNSIVTKGELSVN